MKRFKQFQALVISDIETDAWPYPVHRHNHYELIYVYKGSGTHQINGNNIPFGQGDFFLLGPDEDHYFKIDSPARLILMKFTDSYIHQVNAGTSYGLQQLEYLIKSKETHLNGFHLTDADQHSAAAVVEVILSLGKDFFSNERTIWLQMLTLAVLLQRNMPEMKIAAERTRDMQALFCYIHKHVYQPANLRSAAMAGTFNTTPDYIGSYFKRNTGITLRTYINQYRKELIRRRLESRNYTLKEIAAEFGLTDESHVKKVLQKN
ncbi:AraC family transcriptional regulator [Pedobacter heparinus]|uniref:AraC family transcriptional regulator n=1 Tax=Pedobacter heparinus TaxID=984 RepID=UPI0029311E08|nr:AraC family transcriptional regulator [Pedobacter heparinus]